MKLDVKSQSTSKNLESMAAVAMVVRSALAVRPRSLKLMLLLPEILRYAAQFSGFVAETE